MRRIGMVREELNLLICLLFLTLSASSVFGQTTYLWNSSSAGAATAFNAPANWTNVSTSTTGTNPGSSSTLTNNDIAQYGSLGTGTTIQMNFGSLGSPYALGTISLLSSNTVNKSMGANTATAGVVQLNGTGTNNLILSNASSSLFTLTQFAGGSGTGMSLRLGAAVGTNSTIDVTGTGGVTISTTIAEATGGARGIDKTGTGVLTLSGANTFAGGVNQTGGRIRLGNASGLGTGTYTMGTGATSGATGTLGAAAITIDSTANFTLANAIVLPTPVAATTYTILKDSSGVSSGTVLDLTGNITGGGSNLTLHFNSDTQSDNTTRYRLSGNNSTLAGTMNVNRGVLEVNNANALGTAAVRLDSNANNTIGNLSFRVSGSFSNAVTITSAGAYPIGVTAGNTVTLSSAITSASAVTKVDSGTLILSGTNTYTTATIVSGGTLALGATGSINTTPTITVNSGATFDVSAVSGGYTVGSLSLNPQTLQGVGTVTGDVFIGASGTIRGDTGTGTGALVTRNVTINNGGQLDVEFGTGVTASRLDTSAAGSVLTLNNGAIIDPNGTLAGGSRVIANLATGTGRLFVNGSAVDVDTEIAVYEYASGTGVQDFGTSGLKIDVSSLGLTAGDKFTLNRTGNTLVLQFSPVPEPTTILGVAVGLVAVGGFIRKRLAKKAVVAA